MKCILAGASIYTSRSIVFGAPMCFWTLWLFKLPYFCLDRFKNDKPQNIDVAMKKGAQNYIGIIMIAQRENFGMVHL